MTKSSIDISKWKYVFVYGTLKKGGRYNSAFIKKLSKFVGIGHLDNSYTLYVPNKGSHIPFPVLTKQLGKLNCQGELYLVDPLIIKQLDLIEGVPDLYEREEVKVTTTGGSKLKAYTYLFNHTIPRGMVPSSFFIIK